MALRVMAQEEKLNLSTDTDFIEKCKQAVRDYSAYWSTHDGSGFSTEAERITWAKNRILGVGVMKNPIVSENGNTLAWFFLNAAKGKQYDLAASPVSNPTLIAAWIAANSFEEFVAQYFAIKGNSEIDMSATAN
jgi:hypothetical protein